MVNQWAACMQEAKQKKYKAKKEEQVEKIQASLRKFEVRIEQCRQQMALPMEGHVRPQDKEQLRFLQVWPATLIVDTEASWPQRLPSLVFEDA